MKRLIVILSIFLLAGCSINGNKDFETICRKSEVSSGVGLSEDISYHIYYNYNNNITKVIEKHILLFNSEVGSKTTFDSAKEALKSYGNSNKKFIINVIKDNERQYEIDFVLNISSLKDSQLKEMNFKRYYYDQMNVYKKDMTCTKN